MKPIYVDNNATTMVAPQVVAAMTPYFTELYGNPSSMHSFGGQVGGAIEEARAKVASLINASASEIVFTSCGTESDSTAIKAALAANPDKRHIVTSRVEHPAIKNLYEQLSTQGYRTTYVPVNAQGELDLDYLYDNLTDGTAVVSIMWANNETGVVFPVEEIAAEVRKRGIVFHSDSVQVPGKLTIDVQADPYDMLSLSGHKLHAPKGVGVLYIRKGTRFSPFMVGGHQEGGRRGGTENVASIVGLGAAADLAGEHLADGSVARLAALRDRLEAGLLESVPRAMVNGTVDSRLPNTTSISFEYVEGEAILLMMDQLGICASSGSACTSGSLEPSHVLRAMGVPFTAAHGSIRFSLSTYNTEEEVDYIVENMPPVIARLRELSPFWEKEAV